MKGTGSIYYSAAASIFKNHPTRTNSAKCTVNTRYMSLPMWALHTFRQFFYSFFNKLLCIVSRSGEFNFIGIFWLIILACLSNRNLIDGLRNKSLWGATGLIDMSAIYFDVWQGLCVKVGRCESTFLFCFSVWWSIINDAYYECIEMMISFLFSYAYTLTIHNCKTHWN